MLNDFNIYLRYLIYSCSWNFSDVSLRGAVKTHTRNKMFIPRVSLLSLLVAVSVTTLWLVLTFWSFNGWQYLEEYYGSSDTKKWNVTLQENEDLILVVNQGTKPYSISTSESLLIIPEKTCRRHCGNHRKINKIIYAHMHGAGVSDRESVLHKLANLAGYLCATVEFPKPHISLSRTHNNNEAVSLNSTWQDYFNVTFYQDGSSAVHDLADNPDDPTAHPIVDDMYQGEKYKDWMRIDTGGAEMILHDFEKTEAFSRSQAPNNATSSTTGFIWVIRPNFYTLIPQLRELVPSRRKDNYTYVDQLPDIGGGQRGCNYYESHMPDHMQMVFDQVLAEVRRANEQHAIIGLFHIRRGDVVNKCNTTVPKMKEYIACSFNGTQAKARNITLLFASDERDTAYRQTIRNFIEQAFDHIKVIDIDALILEKVKESIADGAPEWRMNNYYVFGLVRSFNRNTEYASFNIEQRRNIACRDCDQVSSYNIWDKYPTSK